MEINNISNFSTYHFGYAVPSIDEEEKEIMRRLLAYGITPCGDKSIDKAKLREIEEQHARQDNTVSNKYLTVSAAEQERIQAAKKEKRKIANPEFYSDKQNKRVGAKTLGEQVFLAIKMKDTYSRSRQTNLSNNSISQSAFQHKSDN